MGFKDALKNLMYGQEPEDEFEGNGFEDDNDEYYEDDVAPKDAPKASPAAPARPSNVSVTSGNSIEMKVVKPEKLESVTQISDYLLDRKTVLLNLEETNKETARRLIDFLNGVAYAINGNLKKVANNIYVITPNNVEVSGEQLRESQEKADLF